MENFMRINYTKDINNDRKNFDLQIMQDKDFFQINCISPDNEIMGFITFKKNINNLWILKLETNEKFFHQGVASALIDITEYIATINYLTRIEGKFMPDNEFARPFYEKNGYFVPNKTKSWDDYDETWTLYKNLDPKKVKEKVIPNIKVNQEDELEI